MCPKSQSISAMAGRDVEAQAGCAKLRFIDVLAVTHWHSSRKIEKVIRLCRLVELETRTDTGVSFRARFRNLGKHNGLTQNWNFCECQEWVRALCV